MLSVCTQARSREPTMISQRPYELNLVKQSNQTSCLVLHVKVYDQSLRKTVRTFIAREQLSLEDILLSDGCIEYEIWSPDLVGRMNALDLALFSALKS